MALSEDILALFAKTTKDEPEETVNTTVYGTTVEYNGKIYVKIDGSDALTPISKTTDVVKDERVTVDIKNHTATVTGNVSSPAARTDDVKELGKQISEFEIVIADKVSTKELEAEKGRIDDLVSDNVTIKETLKATNADIGSLKAYDVNVGRKLTAVEAEIEDLEAKKVSAEFVEATYATIENLKATNAEVHNLNSTYGEFVVLTTNNFTAVDASIKNLETNKLSAEQANLKYANIDFSNIGKAAMEYFYSQSGLIENVKIGDATITGNLIGVTIKGDLLEGGTVKADKLVVKGTDGLYYKLNTDGVKIEAEQTDYNSINGSVITAKSITASKIDVKDLVAFNATIGGLKLTEGAIYSGVKESVDNSTKGFYLDKDGQMNVGDSTNYIKYYDDADGNRKLEIAADAITFGSTKKSIDKAIDDAVDSVEVGGRNYFTNSDFSNGFDDWGNTQNRYIIDEEKLFEGVRTAKISRSDLTSNAFSYLWQSYKEIVQPGDAFTTSAYYYTDNIEGIDVAAPRLYLDFYDADKNELDAPNSYISLELENGKWIRNSLTRVAPEGAVYVESYICRLSRNGTLWIAKPQLEKSSKASDWALAPEDVQRKIDDLTIGGRNLQLGTQYWTDLIRTGVGVVISDGVISCPQNIYADCNFIEINPGDEITVSVDVKCDVEKSQNGVLLWQWYSKAIFDDASTNRISYEWTLADVTTEWKRIISTITAPSTSDAKYLLIGLRARDAGVMHFKRLKVEKGNKATDWTPAPEDVQQEIDDVGSTADDASERVGKAETLIQQLSDTISMLITDGTGASLMTQTEDGWTFSMGNINDALYNVSNGLDDLTKSVSSTDEAVSVLEAAVNDLGVLSNYVKITTDGDQPCIELGTGNSDFKLLITNTDIRFMEGSDVPAYINNQSLHITKAVVEEELIQGDFIWKIRSNGNMGLMWKGASS